MTNNKSSNKNKRIIIFVAACLAYIFIVVSCVFGFLDKAHADTSSAEIINYTNFSPIYAEKGIPFDFNTLPESYTVKASINEGSHENLYAKILWDLTDENRADASLGKDFLLNGKFISVQDSDKNSYDAIGKTDIQTTVKFVSRTPIKNFSIKIRPTYYPPNNDVMLLNITVIVNGRFLTDAETVLEYSLGDGFYALPLNNAWDYIDADDSFNTQFDLVNEVFAYDDELSAPASLLKSLVSDTAYFRLKTTGGIFEGYSNTVTLSENEDTNDDDNDGDGGNSGVLKPPNINDGSNGGGTSFWTTPSGTASAVAIGICSLLLSIAIGYGISVLCFKKRKTNTDLDNSDGDAND